MHQALSSLSALQVRKNKRYAAAADQGFTMSEVAAAVQHDFGSIDVLVHSLANGPEVTKPLLETSRKVLAQASQPPQLCVPGKVAGHAPCEITRQGLCTR